MAEKGVSSSASPYAPVRAKVLQVPMSKSLDDHDSVDIDQEFDEYDEQLQEDVFLGKIDLSSQLEIKNTFYNVPVMSSMTPEDDRSNHWQSAPPELVQNAWRTKFPKMEAAHNRGECKPCAYFLYKADGCRNSDNCPYCHLCRKGEIKRRKRKKIKALKATMDLLVLAQHGSNQAARSALMLGPEKYEDLYYFFTNHEREDDFFPCLVGGGRLHSKELVEVVRKDRVMRVLKLIGLLGRVAVTTGGMVLNLRALPERHPTKPLNQARYYVVYLELIVLGWYWTMLLYRLLQWIVDTKLSYMGAVLADAARDIASWSSMQLLRNLSMSRLAQRTERVMKECKYFFAPSMQYIMGLIEAVGYITSGLFGVAVLAVKATQIDFVSVHMMSAYSIGEWLRLVSFTMSMVNIFDIDTENRRAVQEFLTSDYEQVVTGMQWPPAIFVAWERTLASLVAAKEGFWTSFLLMATISGKDYKRFLIEEDPEECPVLLKELLTNHPLSSERSAAALKKGMKPEEIERIKSWLVEEGGPKRYFNSLGAYTKLSA